MSRMSVSGGNGRANLQSRCDADRCDVFIVMIHTDPFQGISTTGNMVNFGIKTTARFAVPVFFIKGQDEYPEA